MNNKENKCRRCGTCCVKGGPAFHKADLELIRKNIITISNLITIRRKELVIKPFEDTPLPATNEFLKISGVNASWQCSFYIEDEGCSIYQNRPISCSALECWNSEAIEELIEKDTLTRFDIIPKDKPIYQDMLKHKEACSYPEVDKLIPAIKEGDKEYLLYLENLINEDIRLRNEPVQQYNLSVADELFYFGRPFFQGFQSIGFIVQEGMGRLNLSYPDITDTDKV